MANYVNIELDTTAPSTPTIQINGTATYTSSDLVTLTTNVADGTAFQMKIWGNVDEANSANIKATEGTSQWFTFNSSQQVKLSPTEGVKTLYVKVRDDVYNETGQASDTITLDTSIPVVTVVSDGINKISKISGKNVATFSFSVDSDFVEYKVKVVTSIGAGESTGVLLGTANGSTGVTGTGSWTNVSSLDVQVNGTDLQVASAGDAVKIIKVFVKDASGKWSA
ncbi:hypothetical protein QFZ31_006676 [Neobacillus niacini]|uniref:hypothetical protein n=1 Tax=Neobacillus driksii TaxID=3035913 RepID=UPI0027864126|nr:hypothetical protein [Neobacillus niacini]MDQ0976624.1 hypothetical protein [Neobacillus niacini]